MQSVTYVRGRAKFRRVLRVQDMDRLGIAHKGEDLVFEPENRFTLVLSNKASDSLVAALPTEFRAYPADGDDETSGIEVQEPMTSFAQSVQDDPQESQDDSVGSADDDVKSSKRKSKPDA